MYIVNMYIVYTASARRHVFVLFIVAKPGVLFIYCVLASSCLFTFLLAVLLW